MLLRDKRKVKNHLIKNIENIIIFKIVFLVYTSFMITGYIRIDSNLFLSIYILSIIMIIIFIKKTIEEIIKKNWKGRNIIF